MHIFVILLYFVSLKWWSDEEGKIWLLKCVRNYIWDQGLSAAPRIAHTRIRQNYFSLTAVYVISISGSVYTRLSHSFGVEVFVPSLPSIENKNISSSRQSWWTCSARHRNSIGWIWWALCVGRCGGWEVEVSHFLSVICGNLSVAFKRFIYLFE